MTLGERTRTRARNCKKKKTPEEHASRLSSPSPPEALRLSAPIEDSKNVLTFQPSLKAATLKHKAAAPSQALKGKSLLTVSFLN